MKKILSVMLLSSLLLMGCSCSKKEKPAEENKPNNSVLSNNITDKYKIGEITLQNTTFKADKDGTIVVTEITNNGTEDFYLINYQQKITDSNGDYVVIENEYAETIPVGESRSYTSTLDLDLSNFIHVEYKINYNNTEE